MTVLRMCLLTLCLLLPALPAQAAGIDKAGAAQLKVIVDNFIKEQKKLSEVDGITRVDYQGETMVEEAGGYYAVTLPYTKLIYPTGEQVDVGMVSINASPGDAPGQWKMRVAIPTPIIVTGKSGKEISRMTIGGQRAAGIWDEALQSFVKLDAQYTDINIVGPEDSFKIPGAKIIYDFAKDAAGKWSGPGSITLSNVEGSSTKTASTFKLANAVISFTIDQYNAPAIRAYREKLAALSESIAKEAPPSKGVPSKNHTAAIANLMMDLFTKASNGMKIRYDITGFQMTRPGETINIPKGFFSLDLGGFTTGKARFALQGGYDGLTMTPEPPQSTGLIPTNSNIDIAMENIPINELLELGKNTLDATLQSPDMKQLAMISFAAKVPALLSQSGAFLTITNTHIGNDDIDVKLEGRARADISAVNSATADMTATITGLDILLDRLDAQVKDPRNRNAPRIQQTIDQLQGIKQYARVEKSPTGKTRHVIDLVMTPQGKITVNGQDINTLKAPQKPNKIPAPVAPDKIAPGKAAPVPSVKKAP